MWERRPAPAARNKTKYGVSLPCPAQDMLDAVYAKACHSLFPGASAPHRIYWTAGKLPFRLQSEHGVRCGAAAECSFPDGHAQRSQRRRCADPRALRCQESKNSKAKPQPDNALQFRQYGAEGFAGVITDPLLIHKRCLAVLHHHGAVAHGKNDILGIAGKYHV